MSSTSSAFNRGMLSGALLIVGAIGLYWFISGSDQGSSTLQNAAVIGQVVLGLGGSAFLWLRQRRQAKLDSSYSD